MTKVGVVIGTFGSEEWRLKGLETNDSLDDQIVDRKFFRVPVHSERLCDARNFGAEILCETAEVDLLIFLDADDRLDNGYVQAMIDAYENLPFGEYLIQPATALMKDGIQCEAEAVIPRRGKITDGNWMVIGTAVTVDAFNYVGGFKDWPIYEDWDLWLRCHKDYDAQFAIQPEAIYLVGDNPDSRNKQPTKIHNETYRKIRAPYL